MYLKIYDMLLKVRLRFGEANLFIKHLVLKIPSGTTQIFGID